MLAVHRLIARRLIDWACTRTPGFVIGGAERPYLLRWFVLPRNPLFNVYVHQFLRSDDDRALHDHPWAFNASYLLQGTYIEHTISAGGINTRTVRQAGALKVRLGPAPHRIELHQGPCWTLFVTGPRVRSWGFHCPDRGWVHWKRFTAASDPGAVGPGVRRMTERPILFSAPMVRAILAGTKTQTRRMVKPRKDCDFGCELAPHELAGEANGGDFHNAYCAPGARLWVRETWMDLQGTGVEHRDLDGRLQRYAYAADTPPGSYGDEARRDYGLKWRPSIHMPRAASRITLEVTGVRVERLQDISEADAIAEGAEPYRLPCHPAREALRHVDGFRALWESINGPGSWGANRWVWVISFNRLETNR